MAVCRSVPAVYAASGKINDDVGSINDFRPGTEVAAVPGNNTPGHNGVSAARKNCDVMSLLMKVAGKNLTDLATTSRNNNPQTFATSTSGFGHRRRRYIFEHVQF